jgi:hypothetical protein
MAVRLGLGFALLALAAGPATAADSRLATAPFGTYEVEAGPGGRELTVEARFQPGAGESLELEGGWRVRGGAQLWAAGA